MSTLCSSMGVRYGDGGAQFWIWPLGAMIPFEQFDEFFVFCEGDTKKYRGIYVANGDQTGL